MRMEVPIWSQSAQSQVTELEVANGPATATQKFIKNICPPSWPETWNHGTNIEGFRQECKLDTKRADRRLILNEKFQAGAMYII